MDYVVTFIAQVILGNSSEPEKAFSYVSNQLNNFVTSNLFTEKLQYFAMVFNVPILQNCTSVPTLVVSGPDYGSSVFHSGRPSIAPTSSPSIQPTTQPYAFPIARPSIQPSSAPTYQYTTLWRDKVDKLYDRYVSSHHGNLLSYVDLISYDTQEMYGSCSSWLSFAGTALSTISSSKRLLSITLVHYYGSYSGNSSAQAFHCDDVTAVASLVTHLMSDAHVDAQYLHCGGRNWTTFFCPSNDNSGRHYPAVCVECMPSCNDPLLVTLLPCANTSVSFSRSMHDGLVTMLAVEAEDHPTYGISFSVIVFSSMWAAVVLLTILFSRRNPKPKIHPVSLSARNGFLATARSVPAVEGMDHRAYSNFGIAPDTVNISMHNESNKLYNHHDKGFNLSPSAIIAEFAENVCSFL